VKLGHYIIDTHVHAQRHAADPEFRKKLSEKLLEAFEGVHAKVEILKEGTLPKTEYKGRRVRDNRTG